MFPRILIADDHPAMRMALREMLEKEVKGPVCAEAANGAEAVEKAAQCHPDLVILDLGMPRMNGLQAARKIHSASSDVPILLYTAYNFPSLEREAGLCGVTRVIDKGGSVSQLLGAVEAALSERRRRESLAKATGG